MTDRAPLAPPRDPRRIHTLQLAIRARIRDFDAPGLLDVLDWMGYPADAIGFRGHLTRIPQPCLFHDIAFVAGPDVPPPPADFADGSIDVDLDFDDLDETELDWDQHAMPTLDMSLDDTRVLRPDTEHDPPRAEVGPAPPRRRVIVTANLGLVSCRSPLPSYFHRMLCELDTRDPLLELLGFVDHHLVHDRLIADHPRRAFDDWPSALGHMLQLSNLASPRGLDWLFRRVFPELGVSVARTASDHHVPIAAARVGYATLGACAFGPVSVVPVADLAVTLICHEPTSAADVPWVEEAEHRLKEHVLPVLADSCLHLTVALLLLDQTTYARVATDSYVGYDPLRGGPEVPRRVVVFQGALVGPRDAGAARV